MLFQIEQTVDGTHGDRVMIIADKRVCSCMARALVTRGKDKVSWEEKDASEKHDDATNLDECEGRARGTETAAEVSVRNGW